MTMKLSIGMLGFCLSAVCAQAATLTANSSSFSDVNAAVSAAGRGDTVVVPAGSGSVTWASTLTLTKGIFLKGPGRDSLTITHANTAAILIAPDSTAQANEEVIRVEGFTIDGAETALQHIQVNGAGASATKPFKNLAIGNNRFKNSGHSLSGNGAILTTGQVRGVIYNNIFDRCNGILKIIGNDNPTEWANGHFPQSFGTSDNLYFENNTVQYSSSFGGSDPGWMEIEQGARLVMRYNTFNFANVTCSEYWDIHGFQNWPGNGQTGTMVVEYYGNTFTNTSGYRWIAHRGGWGLFFDNILTGSNGGSVQAWDQWSECPESGPGLPSIL